MNFLVVAVLIISIFALAWILERILFAMFMGVLLQGVRSSVDEAMKERYGESWIKQKEKMQRRSKMKLIKGGLNDNN